MGIFTVRVRPDQMLGLCLISLASLLQSIEPAASGTLLAPGVSAGGPAWAHDLSSHDIWGAPSGVGSPVSEWYFNLQVEPGWISKAAYCSVGGTGGDAAPPSITCSEKAPPHLSLFTFVAPSLPALTGQPLLLLLRRTGLCGTPALNGSRAAADLGDLQAQLQRGRDQQVELKSPVRGGERTAVECTTLSHRRGSDEPHMYVLYGPTLVEGMPLNFTGTQQLYMAELVPGDPTPRFCTVGSTSFSKSALVCDQPAAASAYKFNIMPAAYPFAGLNSLATSGPCGIKSMLHPPPHDIVCARNKRAGAEAGQNGDAGWDATEVGDGAAGAGQGGVGASAVVPASSAFHWPAAPQHTAPGWWAGRLAHLAHWLLQQLNLVCLRLGTGKAQPASNLGAGESALGASAEEQALLAQLPVRQPSQVGDVDRITQWTLVLQKPGPGFVSGDAVAVTTWSQGVVGFPLQQCCPGVGPPYVLDCAEAADPIPANCYFTLTKSETKVKAEPIKHADIVLLRSVSLGRYCSVTVDGTLLCISSYPSNATRMLFRISLQG